jgi:RimJ/RimL family protein N-acetyltransferase
MNQTPIPVKIKFIDFKCPYCQSSVSFPEQFIGRPQECPTCFQILIVPKPGEKIGAKLPIPFQTSKLLLRQLAPIDSNDLLEIVGDENSIRYQDWYTMDVQEVENWLANDDKTPKFQQGRVFFLAVELLEHPKVIGLVALNCNAEDKSEMSVDVFINHKYQRRGFGTEAFRGMMKLFFARLNVRRICAWCDSRNLPGLHLLERSGMRREGQFVKCKFTKGEWVDTVQYALLQEEFVSAV